MASTGTHESGRDTASRALVVLPGPARSAETDRREAGFVTQLVACRQRCPAYRTARRGEPAAAAGAYRAPAPTPQNCFDLTV